MRVLYGVVGEGMGHATRSRVTLEHLLSLGHEVRVVVSGRAHGFLLRAFEERKGISFHEIHGLSLVFDGNSLDLSETVLKNLTGAPAGLRKNLEVYRQVAEDEFRAEVVISDFESWAYFYGIAKGLPVISIDNMQIINRCEHEKFATEFGSFDFRLAKLAVKAKVPGAYHYLITTFFLPEVRKRKTSLIPPILRPEILAARREPGEHVLVYQTAAAANPDLVPILRSLPYEFRVYGLGREGQEGNVRLCAFSETGFVDDLRTAKAVIANGGLSLMAEAVHLHVPMLSIPLEGQFEQTLNARYLSWLGYGMFAADIDRAIAEVFLEHADQYAHALQRYVSRDNGMLFAAVEELLAAAQEGRPPLDRLETPVLGSWDSK